jgi:hypothetical protein
MEKLLEWVSSVAGYKSNIQKSHTSNEQTENEIKKNNSFIIASKRIPYLGANFTKEVKTCTLKNCNML